MKVMLTKRTKLFLLALVTATAIPLLPGRGCAQTTGNVIGSDGNLLRMVSVSIPRLRKNPDVSVQESKNLVIYVLSGQTEAQLIEQLGLSLAGDRLDATLLLIDGRTTAPEKGTFMALKPYGRMVYVPIDVLDDELRFIRPILSIGNQRSYLGLDYGQQNRFSGKAWSVGIYGGVGGFSRGDGVGPVDNNEAFGAVQFKLRF